jgi:phosphoadenosine phosphosulfate reductase
VNAVDDPDRCSVIFSAVHRDGPLVVAVSTSGAAPALAVRLRDRIAEMTEGYGRRLTLLRTFRDQIRTRFPTFGQRRDVWYRIVDTLGDTEPSDEEEAVVQGVIDDHVGRVQVASPTTSSSAEGRIAAALERSVAPVLTCSMQLGGLVLVDQVRRFMPDIPVVFVDTGYHFPETLAFRDRVAEAWNLNLRIVAAEPVVDAHEEEHGVLHRTDPGRCCAMRKVGPAEEALYGHDLWFAAVRRTQGGSRVNLPVEVDHQTPQGYVIRKVHPLVDWSWADIERYAARHDVPRHPLYEQGYTSIGCAPCTTPTFGLGGERAGRWDGTEITECGLHVSADDEASA